MKVAQIFLALTFLVLAGCSTPVQQVKTDVPAIVLKEPQTRKLSVAGTVSVPAGIYQPDFEANNGIYYRAPTHLITKALGLSTIQRGGIFVPNPLIEKEKTAQAADKPTRTVDPKNHASQTHEVTRDFRM